MAKLEKNPRRNPSSEAQLDTSHWDAYRLIKTCRELWESYCERPSKKKIKAVLDHLETMKASKSAKVKAERQRCLRVARDEARELGIAVKQSSRNPRERKRGASEVDHEALEWLRLAYTLELDADDPRLVRLRELGLVRPAPSFEITPKAERILAEKFGDDIFEPF